jgi:hypothetical protein
LQLICDSTKKIVFELIFNPDRHQPRKEVAKAPMIETITDIQQACLKAVSFDPIRRKYQLL